MGSTRLKSTISRLWLLLTLKAEDWSRGARIARMRLLRSPLPVTLGFVLMLFLLAASLTGCGTTSPPPSVGPRNPEPPPTRLSASPPNYSDAAQKAIEQWRRKLTELTAKPAN